MNKSLDQIREMIDDPDTLPEVATVLEHLWVSIACGDLPDVSLERVES